MAQNLGIYAYYSNVKIKLKEDNTGISMSVEKGAKAKDNDVCHSTIYK